MNVQQTPNEEMAERLAEASPVMMLPRVIAAEDYRLSQAAYRNRVEAAHAAGWAALGHEGFQAAKAGAADMGGINIQGDTYQYFGDAKPPESTKPPAENQPAPQPAATSPPTAGTLGKLVGPALLGAALLGSGAGGVALYNHLNAPDAAPVIVDPTLAPDWKFGVEVKDRP